MLNRLVFTALLFVALFFCLQPLVKPSAEILQKASPATKNTYQLWAEPDVGRQPLYQAIDHAQKEIDVVMYLFTDKNFANALAQAADRAVKVRVLIEQSPYESGATNAWLTQAWQGSKVDWHWVPSTQSHLTYYHQKSLLIDHQQLWVMTMNFVHSSFYKKNPERNFILRDDNTNDVSEEQKIFDQDFSNQNVTALSGLSHLVVSPLNAREKLIQLIRGSTKTVDIYAEGLSDYQLLRAIEDAADRGVKVQILYGDELRPQVKKYLQRHHVQLKLAQAIHNHAKAIIVDGNAFYLGSANFTKNSIDANRELGVIDWQPQIAQQLTQYFNRDYQY